MVWTCSSEFFGYVYNEIEKENTMNIQIFGTKKCNDTKKAERFFKERGIKFQFIDMKEKGMSVFPETNCQGLFNQIHKKATKKVPGSRF